MDRDGENAREGRLVGSLRADRDDGNETDISDPHITSETTNLLGPT